MQLGGVVVSVLALAFVFASVDIGEVWDIVRGAEVAFLVLVLAVISTQLLIRGLRWSVLLPPRPDGTRVPTLRTIAPLLVGYLGNVVLPARLGEPIRAYLVARREHLDPLTSFGATVQERVLDVVTLALLGLAAALALDVEWWIVTLAALASGAGVILVGLLVAVGSVRVVDILASVLARFGLAQRTARLQHWARAFAGGLDRGRDLRRLGGALGLSLLAWLLDASIFWLVGRALGIDVGYPAAVVIGAVAVLATAVPSAPGYVGTFELAATSAAVAMGVPQAEAVALALVAHAITAVPIALAGAAAVVLTGSGLRRLAREAEAAERVATETER